MSRRLWLSLRRLLEVHSSGDCGSPRVSGSTSARRSSSKFASVSLRGLRPPPTRRTRSKSGVSPARNSASPRPIVLRAIPVARITAMIPPCPADVASAAAKRRRPRSSSTGARASKRWRMADSSITPKRYSLATPEGIPPANKIRSDPINLFADGPYVDEGAPTGSIRKAATHLNVAASAISRQILALETQLGTPLFQRLPKKLILTAAGEVLIGHIRQTLKELARAQTKIEELKGLRRGEITVAMMSGLASNLVPGTVKQFRLANPRVKLI